MPRNVGVIPGRRRNELETAFHLAKSKEDIHYMIGRARSNRCGSATARIRYSSSSARYEVPFDIPFSSNNSTSANGVRLIKRFFSARPSNGKLQEARLNRRYRALLKYRRSGLLISVVLARPFPTRKGKPRRLVEPPRSERKRMTVVAFLNEDNSSIHQIRVFRRIVSRGTSIRTAEGSDWLQTGFLVEHLSDLVAAIHRVCKSIS